MLSIIKAQLFGLKKERLVIISFFLLLAYELFQLYVYIQAAVWEDLEISLSAGGFAADYITMSHTAALYAVIIITGVLGNIFGELICKLFKITEPISKGLAFGASSHAIGTAKALEIGEVEGAMSGLAIAVSGILTVALSSVFANFIT